MNKNFKTHTIKYLSATLFFVLFFLFVSVAGANPFDIFKFNDNTLDIVQISDVHIDTKANGGSKRMVEYSTELLKDAVSQINSSTNADMVVFSGDVVNRSDKNDFRNFINLANGLKIPWYYAPGNHDIGILGGISKAGVLKLWLENSKLIDKKNLCFDDKDNFFYESAAPIYYSYSPNKKFLILFLDGVIDKEITANGYFPKRELAWMDKQIKNNHDKKVIIVQHFPVVEPSKSASHNVRNAAEYLKILDKYDNVAAVLSGHYHYTKITQRNSVLHISTPSLVEYPNAFREIKITNLNNATKFEIKLLETNLKDVRNLSKSRSKNQTLEEGQPTDRNTVIIIKN